MPFIIPISPPEYKNSKHEDHGRTIDITFEYKEEGSEEIKSQVFTVNRESLDEPWQSIQHKYNMLVEEFRNGNLLV